MAGTFHHREKLMIDVSLEKSLLACIQGIKRMVFLNTGTCLS